MRAFAAVLVVALGALSYAVWGRSEPPEAEPMPRLAYVATAHQLGVVGYRDPAGALSPDGRQLAYTEGRYLRVVPVGGGLSPALPPADGQVRWVAWLGDRRVIVEDGGASVRWWAYDLSTLAKQPLWAVDALDGSGPEGASAKIRVNDLRQVVASADGARVAALATAGDGPALWRISADGATAQFTRLEGRVSSPAWTPSGDVVCLVVANGRSRLSVPCGAAPAALTPDVEVLGPLAVSADGAVVFFASPNEAGMVDLWSMERSSGRARRRSSFGRDTYAPSVSRDGTVLFRTQSYRTHVAELADNRSRQLTTFQSETPWWHPREPWISVTYGTWRRQIDDAKYPDIAQEIGVIDANVTAPADTPIQVIAETDSEDQAMAWSPNGKWIALHSHREMSDDIWLRPTDGSRPDRRITMLGRGAEVGWPRWSPSGATVLLDGANAGGRSVAYTIGVDQESGEVTSPLQEVPTTGFDGDVMHAEWLPDGRRIAALAKEGPGRHAVIVVGVPGGATTVVHRFASEHDFAGLTISPDGRFIGFVAPASDGFYQVFRIPVAGGQPEQITADPSHKTQPAWSPDGRRLAFTVWSYTATFWTIRPQEGTSP